MPVLWESSQRPMFVRTVWVGGFRHAILTHDDPYLTKHRRRRPNSSASCTAKTSRLSYRSNDDLQDCLRKLNLVLTNDKSRINERPKTAAVERLNLQGLDQEDDDDLVVKVTPQPLNDTNRSYDSLASNMRNLRSNKTSRTEAKENTELSDRVFQWLDLAGKVDLLTPANDRMSQPRHSWPELQKRCNLAKSKTAIDIVRRERPTPKPVDSPKAQQSEAIDRHDVYVPTSANTIENYARQSRNKNTPRHENNTRINKTKARDLKPNVMETRQRMMSEKNAVQKQYADMLSKRTIPDVSKAPKRQVHIFMPDLPKKPESIISSRAESLLSSSNVRKQ